MNFNKSIFAGLFALIVATSCCWLPALLVVLGGGTAIIGFSQGLESFSSIFMLLGSGLLVYGVYQWSLKTSNTYTMKPILQSIITCPNCGFQKEETMPTTACQYFYECEKCKEIIKPKNNDCCVFCSFGTVPCPPIQLDQACC